MSIYPLDVSELNKGDTLSVDRMESMTGKKCGTDEFRFAVMSVQEFIHAKSELTAKALGDGALRILTDAEASDHNARLFAQGLRMVFSRHERGLQVDVDQLTPDQRKRHDARLISQSRYVSALSQSRKEISTGTRAAIE